MATKKCGICKEIKPTREFYKGSNASRSKLHYACKKCSRKQARELYKKQFATNPEHIRTIKKQWQENNREKQRIAGLKHRQKVRFAVIQGYGSKCICCGETEIKFLSIDHTNGGGKKHRKDTNGHTYSDLLKRNFPQGFQVLCHNCNLAKGFYGKCPHKTV